jgi:hypothetical protein
LSGLRSTFLTGDGGEFCGSSGANASSACVAVLFIGNMREPPTTTMAEDPYSVHRCATRRWLSVRRLPHCAYDPDRLTQYTNKQRINWCERKEQEYLPCARATRSSRKTHVNLSAMEHLESCYKVKGRNPYVSKPFSPVIEYLNTR